MKEKPTFESDPRGLSDAPRLAFFGEGAEKDVDLMGFRPADPLELVEYVLSSARGMLTGATSAQVRLILEWGDLILRSYIDSGKVKVFCDGAQRAPHTLDFRSLNQMDFLHIAIHVLESAHFVVADDEGVPVQLEVTPPKFCAAYALAMIYNGTRDYLLDTELGVYYLMQASFALGVARSLPGPSREPLADAVMGSLRRAVARRNVEKRLEHDPKHPAMAAIRAEFDRWQARAVRYTNDADFAKKMHAKYADVIANEGSIKNAVSRWRKAKESSC